MQAVRVFDLLLKKGSLSNIWTKATYVAEVGKSGRQSSYQISAKPLRNIKKKSESKADALKFVDWHRVKCTGGKGGDGLIAFLRLWCNPNAGPCGGDGGNGGHVVLVAESNIKSLQHIVSLYRGADGERGGTCDMHGADAEHTIAQVPIGTIVKDEKDNIIADLDYNGAKFIAARGGAGGKGNHFFLSNENRHPRVAELGAAGETNLYHLELKVLAHAGLVGFPNAGKSTLLQAISRARPKIAAYPFTTLNPHVGIVHYDDYEQLAVADLPGLIPGAHKNMGLGISFLRHIERCVCLMYVLDLSQAAPWEQLDALQYELEQYQTGLSQTPSALVANKIDLPEAENNLTLLREKVSIPVFPISARYGTGLTELLCHLRELYDKYNEKKLVW